jgi:serine/threonine protein phosphatase PrpC
MVPAKAVWILTEHRDKQREMQKTDYIKQLLYKNFGDLKPGQANLFNEFVNDALVEEAFNTIKSKQTYIMSKWQEDEAVYKIQSTQIVMPNGTVGKPYSFVFDFTKYQFAGIAKYELTGQELVGLQFNEETKTLLGTPTIRGEHKIIFSFKLEMSDAEKPFQQKELTLIINPDPKSLWLNLDSDKTDKYWQEDNVTALHEDIAGKKLVVSSKRGRSHAHEGKFRDDGFDFAFFEDTGWGVIAVSDGAGSAKYSRKGSAIACETIIDFFRNQVTAEQYAAFDEAIENAHTAKNEENQKKLSAFVIDYIGRAAHMAHKKIGEEATANAAVMKDYAATLIFSIIKKFGFGYCIASFWVGDGGIGIYDKEKQEVTVLGVADGGEYAGQTRFLTMPEIFANNAHISRIKLKIVENFTALVLMTDGISDPKFQTDANLNRIEKWNELWDDLGGLNGDNVKVIFDRANTEIEKELDAWMDFWSPGNHDDRTLAILF